MNILRVGFYIALLIISVVFIEMKKEQVRVEKAMEVESVLSLITEEGLPLKLYKVRARDFSKSVVLNIRSCEKDQKCFFVSYADRDLYQAGQRVLDPETGEVMGAITERPRSVAGTGLYEVRAKLDGELKTPLVRVETHRVRDGIVVPIESVIQVKDDVYVYVYEGERPVRRDVKIRLLSEGQVLLASGLEPGEEVVVEGIALLDIFDKYKVVGHFEFGEKAQ